MYKHNLFLRNFDSVCAPAKYTALALTAFDLLQVIIHCGLVMTNFTATVCSFIGTSCTFLDIAILMITQSKV